MASASREIPYEEEEINNNGNLSNINGSSTSEGAENLELTPQLALIPLHPACKKQKLEAKQLPIVLGRTNLAAWWWKSCPCQHYCRLHCRPVAQNIRSLSKVMIQIDTAGRIHLVGKNPHLITITPERGDNMLHVNDVLSIGRRDREPWMRFQVVKMPAHPKPLAPRKQKTHSPEWMTNHPAGSTSHMPSVRNDAGKRDASPPSNPPEWITTTRKRKSSSSSRGTNANQQLRLAIARRLQEAASAAALDSNDNGSNLDSVDSHIPDRKRRRNRESSEKKTSSRQRNRTDTRKSSDDVINEKNEKQRAVASGTTPETDRHPQVHLVFQDYETSAALLRATQRKRKRENIDATANQNAAPSAPRAFLSDKSQLRLLSRNFAAALLGAVAPGNDSLGESQSSQEASVGAVPGNENMEKKSESKDPQEQVKGEKKCNAGLKGNVSSEHPKRAETLAQQQPGVVNSSTRDKAQFEASELQRGNILKGEFVTTEAMDTTQNHPSVLSVSQSSTFYPGEAGIHCNDNRTFENSLSVAHEEQNLASMLSLPQCASSSFGAVQDDIPVVVPDASKHANPNHSSDETESSPPLCDPVSDLGPWRVMIEEERQKGTTSSFRHALASLVIAKNEGHRNSGSGLLWLPSLLESDFRINRPEVDEHQDG